MPKGETVAELLDLAIRAEEAAVELYRELARKFAHYETVARFWRDYADVEDEHTRWLQHLRETVPPHQLIAPIDRKVLEAAQQNLQRTIPLALHEIRTLEDAYQLAHDIEHSEVNTIFEVLVTNFAKDEEAGAFLRAQLREHVDLLIDGFPAEFRETEARRAVQALE